MYFQYAWDALEVLVIGFLLIRGLMKIVGAFKSSKD